MATATDTCPTVPIVGAKDSWARKAAWPPRFWRLGVGLLTLVRPGQWVKNVVAVGIPLLDVHQYTWAAAGRLGMAVTTFTVAACVVYILNDIADRNRDRAHPTKQLRPIACGSVPVPAATMLAVGLAGLLIAILAGQPVGWTWVILAYLSLTAGYTVKLKHVPIVDVFAVATGFVLRVILGYVALGAAVSGWLVIAVFSGSLLLIIGKRRQELVLVGSGQRPALAGYTMQLADQLMSVSAVLVVASVLLYVRTEAALGPYAGWATVTTTLLGVFGLFRYLQVVLVQRQGENPVRTLLGDRLILVACLLCAAQLALFTALARAWA